MTTQLRRTLPGTSCTSALLTLPEWLAWHSRQACSSDAARRSSSDSYHSGIQASTLPLGSARLYLFVWRIPFRGGKATLRGAVSALRGLLGGNRGAPGMPLIAGRCEHGSRHSARWGRPQFSAAADGAYHSERQARKRMRACVLADTTRTGCSAVCNCPLVVL